MCEKWSNKAHYIYNIPCTYLMILIHGTILLHLCSPGSHSYTQISQSFTPPSIEIPSVLSSFTLHEGVLSIHTAVSFSITLAATAAKSLQSCPTLCDPIDSSPPGSPDPGVLQARTLEWGAIAFSTLLRFLGCHFLLQLMKVKNERWSRSGMSDS